MATNPSGSCDILFAMTEKEVLTIFKSEKALLKSLSQKTRYNLKISQRKGFEIIESKDIYEFTNFWRENFEKKRFPFLSQQKKVIELYKVFGNDACILLARKNSKIIGAEENADFKVKIVPITTFLSSLSRKALKILLVQILLCLKMFLSG